MRVLAVLVVAALIGCSAASDPTNSVEGGSEVGTDTRLVADSAPTDSRPAVDSAPTDSGSSPDTALEDTGAAADTSPSCTPKTKDEACFPSGKPQLCGLVPDGCGGSVDCGDPTSFATCSSGSTMNAACGVSGSNPPECVCGLSSKFSCSDSATPYAIQCPSTHGPIGWAKCTLLTTAAGSNVFCCGKS